MSVNAYYFNNDHGCYLYDYSTNSILKIPDGIYRAIVDYDKSGENNNAVSLFREAGLLLSKPINSKIQSDSQAAYLSFAPVYDCNLRCTYCFAEHGNQFKDEVRDFKKSDVWKALDTFFFRLFPNRQIYRIDFVSGGEPLLNFDAVQCAIEYLEINRHLIKGHCNVWLCTNGTLLTEDIVKYFIKKHIYLGISIDGYKEMHDSYRKDVLGQGSYDSVIEGISCINRVDRNRVIAKNLWALCTATNKYHNFSKITTSLSTLGFQNIQIRLIRDELPYDVESICKEYTLFAAYLWERMISGDLKYIKAILNDNDQFGKVLKRIICGELVVRRCDAGINKKTICPNGEIYPCDSMVGDSEALFRWDSSSFVAKCVDEINACESCKVKYLCGGDCFYHSKMRTGNYYRPAPDYCAIQKHIVQQAICLRYKMENSNLPHIKDLLRYLRIKNEYSTIFG